MHRIKKSEWFEQKETILAILIIFFLVSRLSVLLFGIDKIRHSEELFRGMIANDLIHGSIAALSCYQYTPHEGGSLVTGVLTVPFFLLFGNNLITLKLVSLTFSLASFVCLFLFVTRFFSLRISILSCLLFLLAPTAFLIRSLQTLGNHTEIIFFIFLAMYLFFEIFFENKKTFSKFLLFGITSGFGVYFCYSFSILLITCLIFWFNCNKKSFINKHLFVFLLGFILGFSPWVYYNLHNNFQGLSLYGKRWDEHFSFHNFNNLKSLFLSTIPSNFGFNNLGLLKSSKIACYFYYIIFLISFCVILWLHKRPISKFLLRFLPIRKFKCADSEISKETFIIFYVIIFFILYNLTGCASKVLFSLYPFIFMVIAMFLDIYLKWRSKYLSLMIIVILIITGFSSNIQLLSFDSFMSGINYSGFSYIAYPAYKNHGLSWRTFDNIVKYIKKERLIGSKRPRYIYEESGYMLGQMCVEDVPKILPIINQIKLESRIYFYKGLGILAWKYMWKKNDVFEAIKIIKQVDDKYRYYLYEALLAEACNMSEYEQDRGNVLNLLSQLKTLIDDKYLPYWYIGLGQVARSYFIFIPSTCRGSFVNSDPSEFYLISDQVPEEFKPYFYQGLGLGIEFYYYLKYKDKSRLTQFVNYIPEEYCGYWFIGLGRDFASGFNNPRDCLRAIEDFLLNNSTDNKYFCYVGAGFEYYNKCMFDEALLFFNKAAKVHSDRMLKQFIELSYLKKCPDQDAIRCLAYRR